MRSGVEPGQADRHQRNEEERHRRALDDRRNHQRPQVGLRVEVRAHPQHQREARGTRRSRSSADRPRCTFLPTNGESRIASTPTGASTMPGLGRRVAHVLLQPQRQQHDVAEEQAVGERHRERARRRNCAARTAAGRRPDARSVSSQTRKNAKPTTATTASTTICVEPNQSSSLPLSSMICSAPTQSTSSARPTLSIGTLRGRRLALAVDRPRDAAATQPDRDVDVEDPRPRDVVGDPAAEQRPGDRRDQRGHRPHRQRACRPWPCG